MTGRLKVGATRWRERSAAALLQLILQRGDCLLGAGLVEMAARRTGHANRTKGFIAGLQGRAAQHHGQQHAKAVHTEALTL